MPAHAISSTGRQTSCLLSKHSRDRDINSRESSRSGQPTLKTAGVKVLLKETPYHFASEQKLMAVACPGHITVPWTRSAGAEAFLLVAHCWQMSVHTTMDHSMYTARGQVAIHHICASISDHKDHAPRARGQAHVVWQTFLTGFTFQLVISYTYSHTLQL